MSWGIFARTCGRTGSGAAGELRPLLMMAAARSPVLTTSGAPAAAPTPSDALAGRIVPAVNGVVGHGAILPHSIRGRAGAIFAAMPRRSSKDSPAKLAGRMKRRWRVVLLRAKGEILGEVEAPDVAAAKAAAAVQFDLDDIQRNRIMVQELV